MTINKNYINEIRDPPGNLLAIIVYHCHDAEGITFVTPPELSQQLAYIHHPAGHVIKAHTHTPVVRTVHMTQETLFVKRGRLRVDFYDQSRAYMGSEVLRSGDAVLLVSGGHGFEALDDVEMFEVKQGPYSAADDKVRFEGIAAGQVKTTGVMEWERNHASI